MCVVCTRTSSSNRRTRSPHGDGRSGFEGSERAAREVTWPCTCMRRSSTKPVVRMQCVVQRAGPAPLTRPNRRMAPVGMGGSGTGAGGRGRARRRQVEQMVVVVFDIQRVKVIHHVARHASCLWLGRARRRSGLPPAESEADAKGSRNAADVPFIPIAGNGASLHAVHLSVWVAALNGLH